MIFLMQFGINNWIESLLSHKINNHISYVTTLKEGIYINYRENQDKNYKTRLCLKIKRLTNVFLNLSVFILGWWLILVNVEQSMSWNEIVDTLQNNMYL